MAALESLAPLEKQARKEADLVASTKILQHFVELCISAGEWNILNEQLVSLSKKRGQLKQVLLLAVGSSVI